MRDLSTTHVVRYHCTFQHKDLLFMFIEHMKKGCLTDFIIKCQKNKIKISEDIMAYILKQILLGLKSVHEKQQIHRDIKGDNVLNGENG